MSRYIEVYEPTSLVYVGFATHANDITLHLLKYVASDIEEPEGTEASINETTANLNLEDEGILTDKDHFQSVL
jgi:hypothetical protein